MADQYRGSTISRKKTEDEGTKNRTNDVKNIGSVKTFLVVHFTPPLRSPHDTSPVLFGILLRWTLWPGI